MKNSILFINDGSIELPTSESFSVIREYQKRPARIIRDWDILTGKFITRVEYL